MVKNNSIHLKLTAEQKEIIKQRAESVGLSMTSYILFVVLKTEIKIQQINK